MYNSDHIYAQIFEHKKYGSFYQNQTWKPKKQVLKNGSQFFERDQYYMKL